MFNKRLLSLAAASVLILSLAGVASAGVPDGSMSSASGSSGCIRINPNGSGPSLASESLTVTVTVNDANGDPIPGYPLADINLVDDSGGVEVAICNGGSVADANTNASGVTTISGTLAGGGLTENGMTVNLAGSLVTNGTPIGIDIVSADNSGDLLVDLVDVGNFAAAYATAAVDFLANLDCNASEDLGDVGLFAQDNGQDCP